MDETRQFLLCYLWIEDKRGSIIRKKIVLNGIFCNINYELAFHHKFASIYPKIGRHFSSQGG